MTIHIKPLWDVIEGTFKVETATFRGLGDISGKDRAAFEDALRRQLPHNEKIIVSYPDVPKIVPPSGKRPAPEPA